MLLSSRSPVLDSQEKFGASLPANLAECIAAYCSNTYMGPNKSNDLEQAEMLRARIVDHLLGHPAEIAEVLRTVRQQHGEVRGLLMGCLEQGAFETLTGVSMLMLIDVLNAQGNHEKGELRTPTFSSLTVLDRVTLFDKAIGEIKAFVPEVAGTYTVHDGQRAEFGLTYDGYKIGKAYRLSVPDMSLAGGAKPA